ncbi:hypothetical protein Tco_1410074, partial [Tanacetum coccineum]
MRTASAAAKPCQEDSSEFYLIIGSIYTDQRGTVVFPMVAAARRGRVRFIAACSYSIENYKDIIKAQSKTQEKHVHVDPEVTRSQDGKDHKMMIRDYAL